MRIRIVKPEFWRDAKLAGLSLETKLIYIGLWTEADDSGWLRWEPRQLAIDILPDQPEPLALKLLSEASRALSRRGRMLRLPCGHAVVPNLPKNQWLNSDANKQTHTYKREHDRGSCPLRKRATGAPQGASKGSPSIPDSKVKSSEVRLESTRALAHAREGEIDGEESEFRRRVPPPPGGWGGTH